MDRGRDEEKEQQIMDMIGEDDGSQYLNLSAGDEQDEDEEGQINSDDDEENVGSLTKSSEVHYIPSYKVNNDAFASLICIYILTNLSSCTYVALRIEQKICCTAARPDQKVAT